MADEDPAPIPPPALTGDEVARRTFAKVRRGFDTGEVRAFLERVAADVVRSAEREAELRQQLGDAQRRLLNPESDETALAAALGQGTARILQSAHDAAAELMAAAERDRAAAVEAATGQAGRVLEAAEAVLAERTAEAERAGAEIRRAATVDAEAMLRKAKEQRVEVLSDLARRRRVLNTQVEQLGAGRETLMDILREGQRTLDQLVENLGNAETGARRAAEAAARRASVEPDVTPEQMARSLDQAPASRLGPKGFDRRREGQPSAVLLPGLDRPGPDRPTGAPPSGTDGEPAASNQAGPPDEPAASDQAGPPQEEAPLDQAGPSQEEAPLDQAGPPQEEAPLDQAGPPQEPSRLDREAPPDHSYARTPPQTDRDPLIGPSASPGRTDVDALFARIRAAQAAEVVTAERMVDTGREAPDALAPADEDPSLQELTPELVDESSDRRDTGEGGVGDGNLARPVGANGKREAHADSEDGEDASQEGHPSRPEQEVTAGDSVDDQLLVERRNAIVDPISSRLARRLKRALQDEHNDVLDRLRVKASAPRRSGDPGVATEAAAGGLLPTQAEQEGRYREVSVEALGEAAQAGAAFAGAPKEPDAAQVEALAVGLAEAVVEPLRRQLERVVAESSADDPSVLVERAGAAYREWKGHRIEAQAADAALAAFARGELSGTSAGTLLRWVVHDGGGKCPDCDDNALAGPVAAGDPYPTGQPHPPAHAGCRCLLVPQPRR